MARPLLIIIFFCRRINRKNDGYISLIFPARESDLQIFCLENFYTCDPIGLLDSSKFSADAKLYLV